MNYNTFLIRYGISPDNFKAVVAEPIKTTIKYSYGFENFERFRKRALLIFSKNKMKKEW